MNFSRRSKPGEKKINAKSPEINRSFTEPVIGTDSNLEISLKFNSNASAIAITAVEQIKVLIENWRFIFRWITSVLSERQTQFADERRSDVKY